MRRRAAFELALGIALVTGLAGSRPARAQSAKDLSEARALFAEALQDEEAGESARALEKFQRVQQVKDTPQVRYRIGSCLERLGKLRSAREAYEAAIALGGSDRANAPLVASSREHVASLTRRIPDLTLSPATPVPDGAIVKIDNAVVPPSAWQTPVALDPGDHQVDATATGYAPFHQTTGLIEGAHASVTIPWTRASTVPVAGAGAVGASSTHPGAGNDPGDGAPVEGTGQRTWGWIALGAGAALFATSGVMVVLRHGEIATLNGACPGGTCPARREEELRAAHDRAVREGTLGIVFAGAGVVAAGVGVALLLTAPSTSSATPANERRARGSALVEHVVAGADAHGGSLGFRGVF